ncbi:MAG: hypothetical protein VB100_01390 [Angelakisella sp.]|nr:hypothetical protein [Angelakisella sp.]
MLPDDNALYAPAKFFLLKGIFAGAFLYKLGDLSSSFVLIKQLLLAFSKICI